MTAGMDGAPDSVTRKTQCTKIVLDARIVYFVAKKKSPAGCPAQAIFQTAFNGWLLQAVVHVELDGVRRHVQTSAILTLQFDVRID